MRGAGTRSARASAFTDIPRGSRNSARSTSPGWTAEIRSPVAISEKSVLASSERLMTIPPSVELVIVDDLHVQRLAIDEVETDSPLVVHANAPLPAALVLQRLKTIAGRREQIR